MLELGWFALFATLISIILWQYDASLKKIGTESLVRKKRIAIVLVVMIAWFLGQHFISQTGFYANTSLPPRMPLFVLMPLFLFTFIFLQKKRNSKVLASIPIFIPIFYQSFRAVIELLFYFTYQKGILPVHVTFEGANYDILLGISALFVGLYAMRKNPSINLLIIWNVIGILVVAVAAFTFISSFYLPQVWGGSENLISDEFLQYPFLLLPSFFMPSAVFFHVLSIIQLTNKKKNHEF